MHPNPPIHPYTPVYIPIHPNPPIHPYTFYYIHQELSSSTFEKGLRYCMDTFKDPMDWRRKGLETCYTCTTPAFQFTAVCLACARTCLSNQRLVPYIRGRASTDLCDCGTSGNCLARWSTVRVGFDKVADVDQCLGPVKVGE